jgi:hypothetical protein
MGRHARLLLIILFGTQVLGGYSSGAAQAPDSKNESGRKIAATKAELFHGAKKILMLNGYKFKTIDEAAGTVSTETTSMRVNASDCDCEMIKWQTEDKRPIINVSVDVKVDDSRITIHALIIGDYPKDRISEKMIEEGLFNQISHYLQ